MNTLIIYTDGGCIGNPGRGGWAFVLRHDDTSREPIERNGAELSTTNNRMELTAVIEALKYVEGTMNTSDQLHLRIVTDSEYVRRGISEWIQSWLRNGWKTSNKKPVKNQDLWQELYALQSSFHISWTWVKGHSGDKYNELCDRLVHKAIDSLPR